MFDRLLESCAAAFETHALINVPIVPLVEYHVALAKVGDSGTIVNHALLFETAHVAITVTL